MLIVVLKGESASNLETMRRITGQKDPDNVVISALNVYASILNHQANGGVMLYSFPEDKKPKDWEDMDLVNYIKDTETAFEFFKKWDLIKPTKD